MIGGVAQSVSSEFKPQYLKKKKKERKGKLTYYAMIPEDLCL
jgi:hypothetical protein